MTAFVDTARNKLVQSAKKVLNRNWSGSFTKPAQHLYPHQWSWDAAFIAIGYIHYDQDKAEQELRHLFSGQWSNGMVPHIVFNNRESSDTYFPGPDFWETDRIPQAPDAPLTSGICQPPIHATAVHHILKFAQDFEQAKEFASEMFTQLQQWHRYLYRERDPMNEGLVYIRHPWESGQDNSPVWDQVLEQIRLNDVDIPHYKRKDTAWVGSDERPTDADYDRYIYLVDFFKKRNYEEKTIRQENCPFMVHDVLFNTLLCRANRDLAAIAETIGHDPEPFKKRAEQTTRAINNKLWNKVYGIYSDFDMLSRQLIPAKVISGFLPMVADIPEDDKAKRIFDYLNTRCFCRVDDTCFAAPSYDRSEADYSSSKYWRGPVWLNMNWLLCDGLQKYGFTRYAEKINESILRLPATSGFHEYYDPDSGEGYGSDGFSWSASLFLDVHYRMLNE